MPNENVKISNDGHTPTESAMPEILEKAVFAMLEIWTQYDSPCHFRLVEENGVYVSASFDHQCMTPGELAAEVIEELGLGNDQGWMIVLNQKGLDLMNKGERLGW